MKSNFERVYSIGGISFSVASFEEIEQREPFSLFEEAGASPDFRYVIREENTLPTAFSSPFIESRNYRIYRKDGRVQRRCGFYNEGKIVNPEYAVCQYDEGDFSKVEIITSKDQRIPSNEAMIFKTLFLEHLLSVNNAFMLHSSYIVTSYGAILFTAPSGTGKSTQADLWTKHRGAFTVNGDCSVVRKTKEGVFAYGVPFSGSSNICHKRSSPVAAIVFLGQAKENHIERLRGGMAFNAVLEGVKIDTRDAREVDLAAKVIMDTISQVPVFKLDCVPNESAVEALEAELLKL